MKEVKLANGGSKSYLTAEQIDEVFMDDLLSIQS